MWRIFPALAALVGCNLTTTLGDVGPGHDSGADGLDSSADAAIFDGGEGDSSPSCTPPAGEPEGNGGPVTLLMTEIQILTDNVCDIDGDGLRDNALAQLGSTASEVFAVAISTVLNGDIDDATRNVVHFPWVEDLFLLSDADALLIFYRGRDEPLGASEDSDDDDFDGSELLFVLPDFLDACGEPLYALDGVVLEAGVLEGGAPPFYIGLGSGFRLAGGEMWGTIEPCGTGGELSFCGSAVISELGGALLPPSIRQGSILELLLAGGEALSLPAVAGLDPDVDMDGDGLERLELDEDLSLSRCIDGDSTVIEGPDCWQDARMADGFSFTVRLAFTSARFAGRIAGWEHLVEGECAEPPSESLFDPESQRR